MPLYEYRCAACGHQLEIIQKFSDQPLKKCPKCGKMTLEKTISAPHFQLKGKGWYETDYKSKPTQAKKETKSTDQKKDQSKGTET